jgi:hypothetical protein
MSKPKKPPPPVPPEPPPHLTARSQALWRALFPLRVSSVPKLVLLAEALSCLDRVAAARALIAAEGLTTTTKRSGVAHMHPALKVEKDARAQFVQLWTLLELSKDPWLNLDHGQGWPAILSAEEVMAELPLPPVEEVMADLVSANGADGAGGA